MAMDLILWRHAEAHPVKEGQSDLERALTPKGERQAQRMAEWLNRRLAESTRVLVSPAVRAQQTAKALERSYKTVREIAPDASASALLAAARWPDAAEPVLVVGHQPTLGFAAARVLIGLERYLPMKKAAVWWLRLRERNGEPQVILHAVQGPDLL